jgi:hypothetical protein
VTNHEQHCRHVHDDPRGQTWDAATRAHAAECPSCVAFLEGAAELGRRLRHHATLNAPMPAALRSRLLAQLDEAATPRARGNVFLLPARARRALYPMALAATLAVGMVIGDRVHFGGPAPSAEVHRDIGNYIQDVTHDHYLFSRIGRPLEVSITDNGGLAAWLSESLSFNVKVPPSHGAFRLEGGRVWHTVGRLSALAAYDVGGGRRALLFAVPATNIDLKGAESTTIDGRRVFSGRAWDCDARVWIDGDLAMALVAPVGTLPESWAQEFLP